MIVLPYIPIEITLEMVLKELEDDYKVPKKRAEKRWKTAMEALLEKSKDWIRPGGVYQVFACQTQGNQLILDKGKGILTSSSLVKTIGKSKKVGLFVVTIGRELEKNIKNFSFPDSLILEAIGSVAAEECAAYVHRQIIEPLIKKPGKATVRLSPGWGFHKGKQDWDVKEQKIIFDLLDPEQEPLGVTLTLGYLMVPRKSVSAIVGIKK